MKDQNRNVTIPHIIAELKKEGIAGLPEYEKRLRNNAGNETVFRDLFLEADVALMFSHHGFDVTMRDSPDLRIVLDGEVAYAEVTHFRRKTQDESDEQDMRDSEDLVPVGNLVPTEESEAWDQIACKAKRKANQYREDAPNILVIETSSNAVAGTVLGTAVHRYNGWARSDEQLQKLNAFILIDQWYGSEGNVHYCQTNLAAVSISPRLHHALASINDWVTPPTLMSALYKTLSEPGDS